MSSLVCPILSLFSAAYYLPSLCLVGMCFVNCNGVLAMVLLCLAVGLATPNMAGYLCAHQDLAPNFAGSLMGFTNTFGSLMGVVAPALTGAITYNNVRPYLLSVLNLVYCKSHSYVLNVLYLISEEETLLRMV